MIATTIHFQKLQDWRPERTYCHFRLSVLVTITRGQFLALGVVENPRFAVGILSSYLKPDVVSEMWVFPVWGSQWHFRLSIIVAITWRHFIRVHHGRKSRTCRWNFDAICCSSSDIFPGLVAISLFPVAVWCYSHLLTLCASSPWLKL